MRPHRRDGREELRQAGVAKRSFPRSHAGKDAFHSIFNCGVIFVNGVAFSALLVTLSQAFEQGDSEADVTCSPGDVLYAFTVER